MVARQMRLRADLSSIGKIDRLREEKVLHCLRQKKTARGQSSRICSGPSPLVGKKGRATQGKPGTERASI